MPLLFPAFFFFVVVVNRFEVENSPVSEVFARYLYYRLKYEFGILDADSVVS